MIYYVHEGEYSIGERHGKGKEYFKNNEIKFEGEYLYGTKWNGIMYNYDNKISFKIIFHKLSLFCSDSKSLPRSHHTQKYFCESLLDYFLIEIANHLQFAQSLRRSFLDAKPEKLLCLFKSVLLLAIVYNLDSI